jgi:hypothetical protein
VRALDISNKAIFLKEHIMGWRAEAGSPTFGKRHVLTIMFAPHVEGYPPPSLKAGDEISVAFANNVETRVTVVEASGGDMTIECADGSRWRLSPRTTSDHPFGGVDTGLIPSQDWIIRDSA